MLGSHARVLELGSIRFLVFIAFMSNVSRLLQNFIHVIPQHNMSNSTVPRRVEG